MLLNNEWVNNEIMEEIKNTWKQVKMNTQQSKKSMGHSEINPEREIHSIIEPTLSSKKNLN